MFMNIIFTDYEMNLNLHFKHVVQPVLLWSILGIFFKFTVEQFKKLCLVNTHES